MSAKTRPTLRKAEVGDAAEMNRIENAYTRVWVGRDYGDAEDLLRWFERPDPEASRGVVAQVAGRGVVGWALFEGLAPFRNFWGHVFVDPQADGLGIGSALVGWTLGQAEEVSAAKGHPGPEGRFLRLWHWDGNDAASALLTGFGFRHVRDSYSMEVVLHQAPPEPEAPEGVTIRPFVTSRDSEATFHCLNESFRDHFGLDDYTLEWFLHEVVDDPAFEPNLIQLAESADGEIVGVCSVKDLTGDRADAGLVDDLGVLAPWRGRGLGEALLRAGIKTLYARGKRRVTLDVDASNETGAVRLYERVGMHVTERSLIYERRLR